MIFEYDARAEKCPVPLVKLRLLLNKMTKADFCLLKISDQGSIQDIPKLLAKKGYNFKESRLEENTIELFTSKSN